VDDEAAFFSEAGFFGFLTSRFDLLCPLAIGSSPALTVRDLQISEDTWARFPEILQKS
jgi:hypothetical protein